MMGCKLCSSNEGVLWKKVDAKYKMNGDFVKSKFSVVRCLNCNLLRVEPVLEKDVLTEAYDREYYQTYSKDADCKKTYFGGRLNELERYTRKGKVLDIGCGDGLFLHLAGERGWQSYGAETSRAAVDFARERYKINAFYGPVEELDLKEDDFNLITLWNVVEHMHDPSFSLEAIRGLLTKEGLLVIETPNYRNIWFRYRALENALLGIDDLGIPGHRHLFTPDALHSMLDKMGFDIIEFKFINYGPIRHTKLWPDVRPIKRLYFHWRNLVRGCCNFLSILSRTGNHMRVICKKR